MTTVDSQFAAAPGSLTPLLASAAPSWPELRARYGPLLELVDCVLGVVPNCDPYLEIWPPAFRSYNVMVPNLLNLPVPILGVGGPPPHVVGLAMYVASRTAQCPYCSAHSCSFAMRRGATPEQVAAALLPGSGDLTRGELATVAVARSLARVPCELTTGERDELLAVYGAKQAEWIVLAVAMMGFLNKFMDAVGVELEQSVASEVTAVMGDGWSAGKAGAALDPALALRPTPPVDGLRTRLRLLPLIPGAIRYDRRVQRGVPSRTAAVARFLQQRTGHDFPVLASVSSARARRSITSMLRENLDPASTVVGLEVKVLAAAVFAEVVANEHLADDAAALGRHHQVSTEDLEAAIAFARGEDDAFADDAAYLPVLVLARAAASTPAKVDADVVRMCSDAALPAVVIVEVLSWLSVLQLLHRLSSFSLLHP